MRVHNLKYIFYRYKYPTAIVVSGGLLCLDQCIRIRKNINNVVSTNVLTRYHKSEYIYIQDETTEVLLQKLEIRGITSEFYKIMQLFFWLSTKFKGSQIYEDVFSFHQNLAWRILRLAQDDNYYYRQRAIKILARMPSLSDLTCVQLAQACDRRTAVGIARTKNADLRLIQNPPQWRTPADAYRLILQKLHNVLFKLNNANRHPCLQYVIAELFYETDDRSFLDDVGFNVKSPDIIQKSLQAILHHSWFGTNTKSIVDNGGLEIIVDLYRKIDDEGGNVDCLISISRILSNVSMDPQFHKILYMSGCVKILAFLLRHPDIRVSVPAGRALLNCDVDAHKPNEPPVSFLRNIYSLHPIYRTEQSPLFDIVFVHGLLGGVFVTWRQRDISPNSNVSNGNAESNGLKDLPIDSNAGSVNIEGLPYRNESKLDDQRTKCWPRDWLAKDCPSLRIIGVNYDTNISMWTPMCPIQPNRLTLSDRSENLTESLIAAGLGSRPIIWVAHSMGGLIVKHLLVKCSESSDIKKQNILSNTKGVVMFSTPHKGSQLATLRPTSQYILWPTIEVQELRKNSPALLNLHKKFVDLAKSECISLLSFAERESTFVKPMQMDLRFVESDSSDPELGHLYGLSLDHLTICKPADRNSFLYQKVLQFIGDIINGINP